MEWSWTNTDLQTQWAFATAEEICRRRAWRREERNGMQQDDARLSTTVQRNQRWPVVGDWRWYGAGSPVANV
jgi:hypothetical protein